MYVTYPKDSFTHSPLFGLPHAHSTIYHSSTHHPPFIYPPICPLTHTPPPTHLLILPPTHPLFIHFPHPSHSYSLHPSTLMSIILLSHPSFSQHLTLCTESSKCWIWAACAYQSNKHRVASLVMEGVSKSVFHGVRAGVCQVTWRVGDFHNPNLDSYPAGG